MWIIYALLLCIAADNDFSQIGVENVDSTLATVAILNAVALVTAWGMGLPAGNRAA